MPQCPRPRVHCLVLSGDCVPFRRGEGVAGPGAVLALASLTMEVGRFVATGCLWVGSALGLGQAGDWAIGFVDPFPLHGSIFLG